MDPLKRWFRTRDSQRLAQCGLDPVVHLIHSGLQSIVLVDQRITDQYARHARVFFRESKQDPYHLPSLRYTIGRVARDLVE